MNVPDDCDSVAPTYLPLSIFDSFQSLPLRAVGVFESSALFPNFPCRVPLSKCCCGEGIGMERFIWWLELEEVGRSEFGSVCIAGCRLQSNWLDGFQKKLVRSCYMMMEGLKG